jgi:hypothetical protein
MKRAFERMEESRKKDEKENINKGTSHRRANKL